MDVHKETITATVLVFDDEGRRQVRTKQFGTYWKQLQALAQWLLASLVEQVVVESTGVYWEPVWHGLAGGSAGARLGSQRFCAATAHSAFARSDPLPGAVDQTADARAQPDPEGVGGCQHPAGHGSQRFDGGERARHAERVAARSPR
jgi:hypothetical protein